MQPRTLILASLVAIGIVACGDRSPRTDQARDEAQVGSGANVPMEAKADMGLVSRNYVDQTNATGPARGGPRAPTDTASLPMMLIRTGFAEVRVDSLEPAIAALEALARRGGGYIGNTSFMGGEERRRSATLQIRVPSARFGDLQAGLATIGDVRSLNVQVQDVGEEYTDATARVRSKRQVEARLLELLRTRVGKLSDVVELEQALETVREEIETTEGRLRYLRNQVGLSTMTVTLSEPGLNIAQPGYHPIRDAFKKAWWNFTRFVASIIAASGWVLPLAVVLYGMGWMVVRIWRRRSGS
jgi:uncharacterized protein DUF4349